MMQLQHLETWDSVAAPKISKGTKTKQTNTIQYCTQDTRNISRLVEQYNFANSLAKGCFVIFAQSSHEDRALAAALANAGWRTLRCCMLYLC